MKKVGPKIIIAIVSIAAAVYFGQMLLLSSQRSKAAIENEAFMSLTADQTAMKQNERVIVKIIATPSGAGMTLGAIGVDYSADTLKISSFDTDTACNVLSHGKPAKEVNGTLVPDTEVNPPFIYGKVTQGSSPVEAFCFGKITFQAIKEGSAWIKLVGDPALVSGIEAVGTGGSLMNITVDSTKARADITIAGIGTDPGPDTTPGDTPDPVCRYEAVTCVRAPCDPILVCDPEVPPSGCEYDTTGFPSTTKGDFVPDLVCDDTDTPGVTPGSDDSGGGGTGPGGSTSKPDLVVSALAVSMKPGSSGAAFVCSELGTLITIKNTGPVIEKPFKVLYQSDDGKTVGENVPGIAANGTKQFWISQYTDSGHDVTVWVDSDNVIDEAREDNNTKLAKLLIPTAPPTCDTEPSDTALIRDNKIGIKLKIRPQSIITKKELPYNRLRVGVAVGGGDLQANTDYIYNDFVAVGDGMFEGTVIFDSAKVKPAKGYKILVKAGKHVAKRICDPSPAPKTTQQATVEYVCPRDNAGKIELKNGLNKFDFSKVFLPAGDLVIDGRQDGVVDSTDFAFVRKTLGNEDPELLRVGDINMDGIVDTQDYLIIIANLYNNLDEE